MPSTSIRVMATPAATQIQVSIFTISFLCQGSNLHLLSSQGSRYLRDHIKNSPRAETTIVMAASNIPRCCSACGPGMKMNTSNPTTPIARMIMKFLTRCGQIQESNLCIKWYMAYILPVITPDLKAIHDARISRSRFAISGAA